MEDTIRLRVGILPSHDMFTVKQLDDGKIIVTGGYEQNMLLTALQYLNLPYDIVVPKDMGWGFRMNDGNWTGLMGMMARNEADLVFGRIFLTESRAEDFDYSFPYDLDVAAFATAEPEIIYPPLTFVYPFELELWIAVAITVVCLSVILKIVSSKKLSLLASFFDILGGYLRQPISANASTLSERFLMTAILIGILIISSSYSTVLLSFLTVPFREAGVRDIKTLSKEVEKGNMKLFSPENFLIPKILSNHPDRRVQILMEKIQKNDWYLKQERQILRKYIIHEKNALLAMTFWYRLLLGKKNYVASTDKFTILPQSILMRRNSTLRNRIDEFVHIFYAAGMYERDVDHHFFKKETHFEDSNNNIDFTITLQQTKGVFLCLLIGYFLSIFIFATEIFYYRLTSKGKYSLKDVAQRKFHRKAGKSKRIETNMYSKH